jgi:(5-formylfuran-3-yl)methyl phosphate synthase
MLYMSAHPLLLVSVSSVDEAASALAGGADIVDAKDPHAGALGAVTIDVLRRIAAAVAGARPLSAALGDANDAAIAERMAAEYTGAGAAFVKMGFAGVRDPNRVADLLTAAVQGARPRGAVVAVAYADGDPRRDVTPDVLIDIAAGAGAAGLLIDTANKRGASIRGLIDSATAAQLVVRAHRAGLFGALAGRLDAGDIPYAVEAGADVIGVRGAACDNGRLGTISAARVERLRSAIARAARVSQSTRAPVIRVDGRSLSICGFRSSS